MSSVTERLDAWQLGLSAVLSRPIFGYGPSSFERVATLFADSAFYARYGMRPWVDSAHNYFVHIAASEGVIGVALFALLTIGALVTGWRRALSSRSAALTIALTATLAGALVASLACVTDIAVSFTIASMVGLVTATVAEPREVTVPWARAVAVGVAVLTAAALGFGALLIVGETTYVQAVQSPDPAAQLAGMRRAVQLVPSSLYYRRRLAQTLTATFVASADRQAPPEELRRAADNAEQAAFDAARFDPWSVDARLELLGVLNDANSHVAASTAQHSALAEAKDAAVRWPHNPGVALQLAYAAYDAGDISGSNAALERALAAAPQSVEVWMRLAQNAEHEHHLPEAMRAYRHVISIDPANPAARDSLQRLSAHATPAP